MITYEQYLKFKAGEMDMYDVAASMESVPMYLKVNRQDEAQADEQIPYERFRKCDAVTIVFWQDEDESTVEFKDDDKWGYVCGAGGDDPWNWDLFLENAGDIRFLYIKGNIQGGRTEIPDRIFELQKLMHLDLEGCKIGKGIERLSRLKSLQYLALDDSELEALPDDMGDLQELMALSLLEIEVDKDRIPQSLARLKGLRIFRIGGSFLFPEAVLELSELQHLHIDLPEMERFPEEIRNLYKLEYLELNHCGLYTLPDSLGKLQKLKTLKLYDMYDLQALPEEIGNLQELEYLGLDNSGVHTLPDGLCRLKQLKRLDLSGMNSLRALPDEIGNLQELQILNLRDSGITSLPASFGRLNRLKTLWLCGTQIHKFPPMGSLENLIRCDLGNMVLERIPQQLINRKMKIYTEGYFGDGMSLAGTRLLCQPISLFLHDYEFIERYYAEEKIHLNETKVVFLGDGEAGKSHIIERMRQEGKVLREFCQEATPGIAISEQHYEIGKEKVCLQIWDFGGQEIMHSMHRFFLTDRTLYVIVVNARDNTQDERAQYWLNNIKSFANGCPVILVLNKIDQNPSASINERLLQDDYPQIIETMKMSALRDCKIQFDQLLQAILDAVKEFDSYAMEFPLSWNCVKQELSHMDLNYIGDGQYRSICKKNHVEDEQIQNWLLDWFHDLGVSFNYRRMDRLLGTYMVLKPQWITNAIYIILFNGRDQASNGIMEIDKIIALLKNPPKSVENIRYEIEEVPYILGVMRRFEISYNIDPDHEFIPMMCDRNQHRDAEQFVMEDTLEYWMVYEYLPNNVLHKLMMKMRDDLAEDKIWLTGMILKPAGSEVTALVRMHHKRIEIFIRSGNPAVESCKEYLTLIRRYLLKINQDLNLYAEDIIVYKEGELREEIKYSYLLKHLSAGKNYYFSEKYGRDVSVNAILGTVERTYDLELILKFCQENQALTFPRLQGLMMEWEKNTVTEEKLTRDLLADCEKLQGNTLLKLQGKENDRNTYFRDLLQTQSYQVRDQTLNGTSPGGKSAGELDLLIVDRRHEPFAILEALNLDSLKEDYLTAHIEKLYQYDTWGLERNYLVSYVTARDFGGFCRKYQKFIAGFEYPYPLVEVRESGISSYTDIRILETVLSRNQKQTKLIHILVRL